MIINKIEIKKFRGFQDVEFNLGRNLTIIAGQNGTQKTTLLGMLSQPFSITDDKNPIHGEIPLCGGNFRSSFAEKFKLSKAFDKPKSHEWTLHLNNGSEPKFTIESIKRNKQEVRFWKKGDRSKGSGYIQLPVIYLSLLRLLPIGEDDSIDSSKEVTLTRKEFEFYEEWHNKILIIPDVEMIGADYLASKQKNTLGANTSYYDWRMNSAGQDNIGKILLAILSFKRLKEKYGDDYKGGILAIDELDATLYPASQLKLIKALRKFSSKFDIQIIYTTHSLSLLKKACELQEDPKIQGQTKVIYLEKSDNKIKIIENIPFEAIQNKLNVALSPIRKSPQIPVFTEDKEAEIMLRSLLKSKGYKLKFTDCTLGCDNLLELARKQIPGFKFPDSLVVLDGDVKESSSKMKRIKKLNNILLLPTKKSPEVLLAEFLYNLSDESDAWNRIYNGYTKQFAFHDYRLNEIKKDREKAKAWFNSQKENWGRLCARLINEWIKENKEEVDEFIEEFEKMVKKYSKFLNI